LYINLEEVEAVGLVEDGDDVGDAVAEEAVRGLHQQNLRISPL